MSTPPAPPTPEKETALRYIREKGTEARRRALHHLSIARMDPAGLLGLQGRHVQPVTLALRNAKESVARERSENGAIRRLGAAPKIQPIGGDNVVADLGQGEQRRGQASEECECQ